jgi:hypothetical protein
MWMTRPFSAPSLSKVTPSHVAMSSPSGHRSRSSGQHRRRAVAVQVEFESEFCNQDITL